MKLLLTVSAAFLCCSFVTKNARAEAPTGSNGLTPPTGTSTQVQTQAPTRGADSQTYFYAPFHRSKKSTISYPYKNYPEYLPHRHVKGMAFTKDGKYLNTGVRAYVDKDNKFKYGGQYDTFDISRFSEPVEVNETKFGHGFNYDNQFSPDGRFLFSINQDGQVRIDNVEDMKKPQHVSTLAWPDGQASCLTISQDGKFMVVGGRNKIFRVYDISNPLKPLEQSKTEVGSVLFNVALSPDQKWVAFVGNGFRLKVYDLSDLTAPKLMSTDKYPEDDNGTWTVDLTISPDSRWLAVAGYTFQHSLLFYNMESPENPTLMSGVKEVKRPVSFVDISRDGKLMAMGTLGKGSGVTIFDVVNPDQPLQVDFVKAYESAYGGAFSPVRDELIVDLGREELELYEYRHHPDRLIRPDFTSFNCTSVGDEMGDSQDSFLAYVVKSLPIAVAIGCWTFAGGAILGYMARKCSEGSGSLKY